MEKEKNEVIFKIKDIGKKYSFGDRLDEEPDELKKPLDEKVKKIDEELIRTNGKESEDLTPIKPSIEIENNQTQDPKYSNAQALWKLALILILTFTLYSFYWFYRNWKHLKIHKNLDISPGWRTVGLFIPILSIFLIYEQLKDIRDLALQAGCKAYSSPGGITFGIIFLNIVSIVLNRSENSDVLLMFGLDFLVNLLFVSLLLFIQGTLNDYWKKEQNGLEMRKGLSDGEIALLLTGVILWTLTLALLFRPV